MRTTEPNTAQTERVLTRLVDPMTPHLWTAVCISQAKECLHNSRVLSLFHPVLSFPVLHAQLFVVLGFTLRALKPKWVPGTFLPRFPHLLWIFLNVLACFCLFRMFLCVFVCFCALRFIAFFRLFGNVFRISTPTMHV